MAVHPHIVIIGDGFTGSALAIHLGRQGGAERLTAQKVIIATDPARGRFGELTGLPQVAEHAQALAAQPLALLTSPALDGRCPLSRR